MTPTQKEYDPHFCFAKNGDVRIVYAPQTAAQIRNGQAGSFPDTTHTGGLKGGIGGGGQFNSNELPTKE